MMTKLTSLPETLRHPHTFGVVIPYSSNLKDRGVTSQGEERLSFYSAFALNAAIEMYEDTRIDKFVLLSDAIFGKERKSTGLLMKEALLRANTRRRIQETGIVLFDALHLNSTPAQIKVLAYYQRQNNLQAEPFLLIVWGFHDKRIQSYMRGFGLKADTIIVEEAHKYYHQKFQLEKLQRVLPKEFEEREEKLRHLAHIDKRGFIPRFFKLFTGPVVTDIKKVHLSDGASPSESLSNLVFENPSGKKKLRQQKENKQRQQSRGASRALGGRDGSRAADEESDDIDK
jgi:hypothetical protein